MMTNGMKYEMTKDISIKNKLNLYPITSSALTQYSGNTPTESDFLLIIWG
jgi:hypothetical protein